MILRKIPLDYYLSYVTIKDKWMNHLWMRKKKK